MKRNFLIFFLIILTNILYSQTELQPITCNNKNNIIDQSTNIIQNEIVYSPFGPILKSNIHYVDRNHHIEVKDNSIQIIDTKSDTISEVYFLKKNEKAGDLISKSIDQNFSDNSDFMDGWITHSYLSYRDNSLPISLFSTTWIVPSPPSKKADQVIYIFNGMETIDSGIAHIVQPVLQWGVTPAGGGDFWAICNWYVTSNYLFFHDSLIKVNPGDTLKGIIKLTSSSGDLFNYNVSFFGYPSSIQVNAIPPGAGPYIVLESFNIKSCDEYPADEKIRMYNIQIITDSIYPLVKWETYTKVNDCGQFTNLINGTSNNGEVDIHFHKPYSDDSFEDIYIYPNPIRNILHISLSNPIFYCKIEVYNSLGNLILTETHETLEYSYILNLQNYVPGLYLIKIYYKTSRYTYERAHIFKIIKITE